MSLEEWFIDLDKVDEELAELMKKIREQLTMYPSSNDFDRLNLKSFDIELKKTKMDRGDLFNAVIGSMTFEPVQAQKARRNQQFDIMLKVTKSFGYDPLSIPDGGKKKIKEKCLREYARLFTSDGFDHAWKAGKKLNPKLIEMENEEKYKR